MRAAAIGRRAGSGRRWEHRALAWALGAALTASLLHLLQLSPLQLSPAHAAPPRPGAAASARQKTKATTTPRGKARAHGPSAAAAAPAPTAAAAPEPPAAKPSVAKPEAPVSAPASAPANAVVRTEERAGEKTYTFGAQEVEGRLKSPQILYFLRRVRAQFDPAPLGHRSFLLELSDTRRHPAF
jgi:hypothetical protein